MNFRNAANASLTTCGAVSLAGTGVTKTATCSLTETTAGTKTYNALYSGDTNFNAGTNPTVSVTLTAPDVATTTTVSTSATTLDYPNTPTLTATVAATPNPVTGGTVTFKRLNIDVPGCVNLPLTTAGANKIATCTPASASLPVGAHTFTAHYGGVAGFTSSSGTSPAVTINEPPPANNNVGSNSEANPVLVDAFYVHPDHLGTPRVVTKPLDNKRVWEWESTPFGESAANENPQNVSGAGLAAAQFRFNLRFPGQVYDAESGKHYNYFRDYDASVGRYVESDPIGLRAGVNTYGYVGQKPLVERDFFGLATFECTGPLHALGSAGPPLASIPGSPLYHNWLCVNGKCGGQDRAEGPWGPGKPSDDAMDRPGATCRQISGKKCVDNCVLRFLNDPNRPPYALLGGGSITDGMNCQQYAQSVKYHCLRICVGQD